MTLATKQSNQQSPAIDLTQGETDAPKDQQVEVILLADIYNQFINKRLRDRRLVEEGIEVPQLLRERTKGERFMLDKAELPRLLAIEAVQLPEDAEALAELDKKLAELDAEQAKIKAKHEEAREEIAKQALSS